MAGDEMARKAINALHKEVKLMRKDLGEVKKLVRRLAGLTEKEVEIRWGGKKEEDDGLAGSR